MLSRVLSTTTCPFILFLRLNMNVAGTATPTHVSNSTNIIDYATTSADNKRIDDLKPRSIMEFTFNKLSVPITPCLMSALPVLRESAIQHFREGIGATTYRPVGYPTISITSNSTPNADMIETCFPTWGICKGATNDSENQISEPPSNAGNQFLSERLEQTFLTKSKANSTHDETPSMRYPREDPILTVDLHFFDLPLQSLKSL